MQQDDNNIEKPLYYESRTLSNAENNYNITELEGLAAFYCVKKFKLFLTGNIFKTTHFTDHKPLVYIFKNKEPTSSSHVKWIKEFSTLKINVKYEDSKKNVVADALFRMSVKEDYKIYINDNKNSLKINNNFKEGESLFKNQNKEINNLGKYKNKLKEKIINHGDNIHNEF